MILTGRTGLEFWLLLRHKYRRFISKKKRLANDKEQPHYEFPFKNSCVSLPLEIVSFATRAHSNENVTRCRVKTKNGKVPGVQLFKDTYVASPEYCLYEYSLTHSLVQANIAASEICSAFTRKNSGERQKIAKAKPLSSAAMLLRFANDYLDDSAEQKFLTKIRFAVEGAFSPPEVALALYLGIDPNNGGYGFPRPGLNKEIEIKTNVQSHDNLKLESSENGERNLLIKPDLYWSKFRLALEYDSNAYHSEKEQLETDSTRRSAFQKSGYSVMSVTEPQFRNVESFNDIAQAMAKIAFGSRTRYREISLKRRLLHFKLMKYFLDGQIL